MQLEQKKVKFKAALTRPILTVICVFSGQGLMK
jgi:hypothetical protein